MNAENNKLVRDAVPTLFDLTNKPAEFSRKRKLPQGPDDNLLKEAKVVCATEENSIPCAATSVPLKSECSTQTDFEVPLSLDCSTQTDFEVSVRSTHED